MKKKENFAFTLAFGVCLTPIAGWLLEDWKESEKIFTPDHLFDFLDFSSPIAQDGKPRVLFLFCFSSSRSMISETRLTKKKKKKKNPVWPFSVSGFSLWNFFSFCSPQNSKVYQEKQNWSSHLHQHHKEATSFPVTLISFFFFKTNKASLLTTDLWKPCSKGVQQISSNGFKSCFVWKRVIFVQYLFCCKFLDLLLRSTETGARNRCAKKHRICRW